MQTVDITLPGSSLIFQAMKVCPATPEGVSETFDRFITNRGWRGAPVVRIMTSEGDQYTWKLVPDTWSVDLHVRRKDGSTEMYWSKPTLADAIRTRNSDGDYFQFHSNGDVTARGWGRRTYFWSGTEAEVAPTVDGTYLYGSGTRGCNCECDDCITFSPYPDTWYPDSDDDSRRYDSD